MSGLVPTGASQSTTGGLRLIGKLPQGPETQDISTEATTKVTLVDPVNRRLYYVYGAKNFDTYLREYDLSSAIPKPIRERKIFDVNHYNPNTLTTSNTVALDTRRRLLFLINNNCFPCTGDTPSAARVEIIDLKKLAYVGFFDLARTAPVQVYGMTYSAEDNRLYFMGEMEPVPGTGVVYTNPQSVIPATITATLAVDATTGKLAWLRPVPECQVPLASRLTGGTIARSRTVPALYFGCVRPGNYPGESGVARLWIDPVGGLTDALNYRLDFFPISGSFTGDGIEGASAFDYTSERFFMQSVDPRTPGAWVFDGKLSAWVGFIGAPDGADQYYGLDQGTGHYYIAGGAAEAPYLVVAGSRSTPVPQGTVFQLGGLPVSYVFTDAPTRRLIVAVQNPKTNRHDWLVYQDQTPNVPPAEDINYDSLTSDIPEGPNTVSEYSGSVNGFGSQIEVVGGAGGLENTVCPLIQVSDFGCPTFNQALKDTFNISVSPGDRAVFAARVSALDLRNTGAAAAARTLALDHISDGEYETAVRAVASRVAGKPTAKGDSPREQAALAIENQLRWPHPALACLDTGGAPQNEKTPDQTTTTSCDLGKTEAAATSRFEALALQGISIGFSSFDTEAHRDSKLGIVTTTSAVARNVDISVPGVGGVTIGRVVATVTTAAKGRPGTASVNWDRIFEGVVVKNGTGQVVFSCTKGQSCDPDAVVAAINSNLKTRVLVRLPTPEISETAGGAFAAIQESLGDYYNGLNANDETSRAVPALEITVFNDTAEKSRILVQLAAIQASSIYGISPIPPDEQVPGFPDIQIPGVNIPGPVPTINTPGPVALPQPTGPIARIGRSALFLIRSPKEAFLFGLTILLFAGAVAAAWRRRVLTAALTGGVTKRQP